MNLKFNFNRLFIKVFVYIIIISLLLLVLLLSVLVFDSQFLIINGREKNTESMDENYDVGNSIAEDIVGEKKQIVGKILVKDYLGNALIDFPINYGHLKYKKTDSKGVVSFDVEQGKNIFIRSGNKDWKIKNELCDNMESSDCASGSFHSISFNTDGEVKEIIMLVVLPEGSEEAQGLYENKYLNFSFIPPKLWREEFIKDKRPFDTNANDYYNNLEEFKIIYSSPYVPQDKITIQAEHINNAKNYESCKNIKDVVIEKDLNNKSYCFRSKNSIIFINLEKKSGANVERVYADFLKSIEYISSDDLIETRFIITNEEGESLKGVSFLLIGFDKEADYVPGEKYEMITLTSDGRGEFYMQGSANKDYYIRNYDTYGWKINDDFCENFFDYNCRFWQNNFKNNSEYLEYKYTDFPWGHRIRIDEGEVRELEMKRYDVPMSNGDYFNKEVYESKYVN